MRKLTIGAAIAASVAASCAHATISDTGVPARVADPALAPQVAGPGTPARSLGYADILGTWCASTMKYRFTRKALTVSFTTNRQERVVPVREYRFGESGIDVRWEPTGNTVFYQFSVDHQTMAQQGNSSGTVPKRPFWRCQ